MNQKHHFHPVALTIHGFGVQGTVFHIPLEFLSNCAKYSTRTTETDSEKRANSAQIFSCFLLFVTTAALPEQTHFGVLALGSVIPQSSSL